MRFNSLAAALALAIALPAHAQLFADDDARISPAQLLVAWSEARRLTGDRQPARRVELDVRRRHYNTVRLHAGIGYVTPDDEHEGRGTAIRKAREAGLEQARLRRLAWHRDHRNDEPDNGPDDVG